jgi:hypothetical protein
MECTASYHIALFSYLTGKGYRVAIIKLLLISNFTKLSLRKTKTDKKDALTIAQFLLLREEDVMTQTARSRLGELKDLQFVITDGGILSRSAVLIPKSYQWSVVLIFSWQNIAFLRNWHYIYLRLFVGSSSSGGTRDIGLVFKAIIGVRHCCLCCVSAHGGVYPDDKAEGSRARTGEYKGMSEVSLCNSPGGNTVSHCASELK